jgi:hypothetical protein
MRRLKLQLRTRRSRCRAGLGLVEALISLAIVAMLLTAAGAAFCSSGQAIEVNDEFFRASQAARVSLNRMLTQCRKGTVLTTSASTSLDFNTDLMKDVSYSYDATDKELLFVTNDDLTDPDYVLARNVTACAFSYVHGTNPATGDDCISRIAISITVTVGNNSITLCGSAAPRAMIAF